MLNTHEQILERKIESMFPDRKGEVAALLSEYGNKADDREPTRVRLAIVKLSGGNYNKLGEYVQIAKQDYRDVLAWAEYPEEIGSKSWELSTAEVDKIRERDLDQYRQWLDE